MTVEYCHYSYGTVTTTTKDNLAQTLLDTEQQYGILDPIRTMNLGNRPCVSRGAGMQYGEGPVFEERLQCDVMKEDEEQCVEEWLATLATAQAALDRLQIMLGHVDSHLAFWRARLDQPRHGLFLLIGQVGAPMVVASLLSN